MIRKNTIIEAVCLLIITFLFFLGCNGNTKKAIVTEVQSKEQKVSSIEVQLKQQKTSEKPNQYSEKDIVICQKPSCPIYSNQPPSDQQLIGTLMQGQRARPYYFFNDSQQIMIETEKVQSGMVNISDIKIKGDFENKDPKAQKIIKEYIRLSKEIMMAFGRLGKEKNDKPNLFIRKSEMTEFDPSSNQKKSAILLRKTIDMEECGGTPVHLIVSDRGYLESGWNGTFLIKDFPKMKNRLTSGLSIPEVKKILGVPTRENKSMLTYSLKEDPKTVEYTSKPVVEFLRLYFVEGKLVGIWIIPFPFIC